MQTKHYEAKDLDEWIKTKKGGQAGLHDKDWDEDEGLAYDQWWRGKVYVCY